MRKFRDLMEAKDTVVFAYGRFNPPTTGHEKLIQKVVSVAGSNDYRIYPSHSQNPKKDPLPQALKTAYMRKMFRKYARNIIVTKSRNAIEIAVELYDQGYKNLVMIAGSDRVKVFDAMLNNYNGVEGKGHGYYKFDSIKIVSAGERDPDSEGVEGMSASKMRAAASNGDMDSFLQGVPSGFADGKKLYRDVRKYMGIREERDMGDMTDFESMRDAYLTGKVWNVGDIVEANGLTGEIVRKGTNYLSFMTEDGKVHKAWLHDIEERNYRNEYDNYHARPEQRERNAARLRARRQMEKNGKVKKFDDMDVHHKDNNPLNNEEDNLEVTTKKWNRTEPRLRNEVGRSRPRAGGPKYIERNIKKHIELTNKYIKQGMSKDAASKKAYKEIVKEEVELDEVWWDKAIAKLSQVSHPKEYGDMVVAYAKLMKQDKYKKRPNMAADQIAREYSGVSVREFIRYINTLVAKKILPQELRAEYTIEEWSFKDFVHQIQKGPIKEVLDKDADVGDYIDDFVKSDAPQFKGKSKEKRKEMAIAAYYAKKES